MAERTEPAPGMASAFGPEVPHPTVWLPRGTVILHRASGIRGRLEGVSGGIVSLRDAQGALRRVRSVPAGFALAGETVTLAGVAAQPRRQEPVRTPSGSVAAPRAGAKVAQPSRIWVEGDHDARLLERVWGDDLRDAAIVVEPLGGIDDLEGRVADFEPGPSRKLGVLVDHLVAGSKESLLAARVRGPHVAVVGHPFVDVWQCIVPRALGIGSWPEVPRDEDWKTGVCARLGWGDPREGWRRVLGAVGSYADLDASLVGAVESLLDFLVDASDPEGGAGR